MALRSLRPCVFFFQAEDGIRDLYVTGVQTCALPICPSTAGCCSREDRERSREPPVRRRPSRSIFREASPGPSRGRSEERRVGKECRSRWSRDHVKNKAGTIVAVRANLIRTAELQ